MSKAETLRRRRLGDLQRLYRHRHGSALLTPDDAGREYLYELLLLASLTFNPERSMRNAIGNWAPWMDKTEAAQTIDVVNRTPIYLRKPSARVLGERMRLTSQERKDCAIVTIRPFDRTDEELVAERKDKDRVRKWRKRRAKGKKDRDAYLANCKSRIKPWERFGIGRRQWERRQSKLSQVHVAGVSAVKIANGEDRLASSVRVESQQEGLSRKQVGPVRKGNKEGRKAA